MNFEYYVQYYLDREYPMWKAIQMASPTKTGTVMENFFPAVLIYIGLIFIWIRMDKIVDALTDLHDQREREIDRAQQRQTQE